MRRKLLWLLLPVVVVAAPPVLYNAETWWTQLKERVTPLLSLGAGTESGPVATDTSSAVPASPEPAAPKPAISNPAAVAPKKARRPGDTPTQVDVADVLRFDVTPAWVMERWPWISAGLSRLTLQGYRVPLVTGTATDDLAGSLTYYFNARQMVEQITFDGTTGDAGKLLKVLIGRYGFGRRLTNNPGLFRYEAPELRGPARSFLNLQLVQPNDAHRRYHVELVMERPEQ